MQDSALGDAQDARTYCAITQTMQTLCDARKERTCSEVGGITHSSGGGADRRGLRSKYVDREESGNVAVAPNPVAIRVMFTS